MKVIGIDLAGSEKRDSGICILNRSYSEAFILNKNKEILELISKEKPAIVAMDAPLSLPKGREDIEERNNVHFRECDLELRKLGIRFFPITLGPMRMLTKRGMALKEKIDGKVIEVYPGATYDLFGIERKNKEGILEWAKKFGVEPKRKGLTQDELDGISCAITGKLFLEGKARGIGNKKEGLIIIPK